MEYKEKMRKNRHAYSRQYFEGKGNLLKSRRSQLTVFVIIAIVIVAVLIAVFYNDIRGMFISKAPAETIPKECIINAVKNALNYTMLRGGDTQPQLYFMYDNTTVDYLCYTSEWYSTCMMQKPLLKQSVEKEAEAYATPEIKKCVSGMEDYLKAKGWNVKSSGISDINIEIKPESVETTFDITIDVSNDQEKISFDTSDFKSKFSSGDYSMIMIASSIENYEARYGDSEITTYMSFYPNIRVEKYKQMDGTKVYIISDRTTGEKLQFATRSLAWPPGYAA
jgi:hypothetical protein